MSDQSVQVVLCTCPVDAARELARALVAERLVACVNVVPGPLVSVYRWQGEVCEDAESLLVIKTTAAGYPALEARLTSLHPYDVPEILALDVARGAAPYLAWVAESVAPDGAASTQE